MATKVMPPQPAGNSEMWWDRPVVPPPRPREIPWSALEGGDETADQSGYRSARAALSALTYTPAAEVDPRLVARATPNPGPLLGGAPPGVTTSTGGGVLALEGLFGDQRRYGQDGLVDRGLGDAEVPVREMSLSHLMRDKFRRLETTVNMQIRLDPNLWVGPNGLCPLQLVPDDESAVVWDELIFAATLAQPTPELAPTRIMGHRKRRFTRGYVRYGYGVRNTLDFVESGPGKELFYLQIQHIVVSIMESLAYGALYAFLEANHVALQIYREHKSKRSDWAEREIIKAEKARWHITAYDRGFHKLDAMTSTVIRDKHGVADTWILPHDATTFITLEPRTANDASWVGAQSALTSIEDSEAAIQTYRANTKVVVARSFSVDEKTTVDPLQFVAQIGHYVVMTNPYDGVPLEETPARHPSRLSAQFYSADSDDRREVTFKEALEASKMFGAGFGKNAPGADKPDSKDPKTLYTSSGRWATFGPLVWEATKGFTDQRRLEMFAANLPAVAALKVVTTPPGDWEAKKTGTSNEIAELRGKQFTPKDIDKFIAFLNAKFNAANVKALLKSGATPPFTFLLARQTEYATLAGIKTKMGDGTAKTFMKRGRFVLSADGVIHEVGGSFIYFAKAVVLKTQNVCVAHNIFVNGYRGGEGMVFIDPAGGSYDPMRGKYGDTDHGADEDVARRVSRDRPSIICMAVPYGWAHDVATRDVELSLHGELAMQFGAQSRALKMPAGGRDAIPTLGAYEELYRFKRTILPSPDPLAVTGAFVNQIIPVTAVLLRGESTRYDVEKKMFVSPKETENGQFVTTSCTHWGTDPALYMPGAKAFRTGELSKIRVPFT